jgi:hypothetical protein
MMSKKILILLVLLTTVLLSSCVVSDGSRGAWVIFDDSDKKVDARLEQILELLADNDRDGLKTIFSKQALADTEDFEEQLDYLFSFFQGTVESWTDTGSTGSTTINNGKKSDRVVSWYTVTTSEDIYSFRVIEYLVDTFNPDNVGVYTLCVIKEIDKETKFTYWRDMEFPGIYIPEWDKDSDSYTYDGDGASFSGHFTYAAGKGRGEAVIRRRVRH